MNPEGEGEALFDQIGGMCKKGQRGKEVRKKTEARAQRCCRRQTEMSG
jgi:hypothetical protein